MDVNECKNYKPRGQANLNTLLLQMRMLIFKENTSWHGMFQQYCNFVVLQFISKAERLSYLLLILKKVQTQHPTAARRLKPDFSSCISKAKPGVLHGVVRVLVCWAGELQRSTFLGRTSPRHGGC